MHDMKDLLDTHDENFIMRIEQILHIVHSVRERA